MQDAYWGDGPGTFPRPFAGIFNPRLDLHPQPHRRFRDPEARLFAESGADALRTAITKACKAEGIALWSPHDLRHRRISLLHARGVSWARIAEFVGHHDAGVTSGIYTHVIADEAELDYATLTS